MPTGTSIGPLTTPGNRRRGCTVMTMITVTVGEYQYRTRVPKDGEWRDGAARAIRARYGKHAKAWSWIDAGQGAHVAAVVGKPDPIGGHVEILGNAIYIEDGQS